MGQKHEQMMSAELKINDFPVIKNLLWNSNVQFLVFQQNHDEFIDFDPSNTTGFENGNFHQYQQDRTSENVRSNEIYINIKAIIQRTNSSGKAGHSMLAPMRNVSGLPDYLREGVDVACPSPQASKNKFEDSVSLIPQVNHMATVANSVTTKPSAWFIVVVKSISNGTYQHHRISIQWNTNKLYSNLTYGSCPVGNLQL